MGSIEKFFRYRYSSDTSRQLPDTSDKLSKFTSLKLVHPCSSAVDNIAKWVELPNINFEKGILLFFIPLLLFIFFRLWHIVVHWSYSKLEWYLKSASYLLLVWILFSCTKAYSCITLYNGQNKVKCNCKNNFLFCFHVQ